MRAPCRHDLCGLVTVTVLAVAGCDEHVAAPTPMGPSPSPLVHVFARVLDYKTNAGVGRSTIAFYIPPLDATAANVIADESGFYSATLPPGKYNPRINGDSSPNAGDIVPGPAGSQYFADYYVNGGDCVLIYGTVRDAATGQPIAGATVRLLTTTETGMDGSYRFDLGCSTVMTPGSPPFGTGTIFMVITASGYATAQPYGTRREFIRGLYRVDVALVRGTVGD